MAILSEKRFRRELKRWDYELQSDHDSDRLAIVDTLFGRIVVANVTLDQAERWWGGEVLRVYRNA
ncbi:MAG: hypothetical protein ACREX3_04210 [Gammaproteobacteria bacterium]